MKSNTDGEAMKEMIRATTITEKNKKKKEKKVEQESREWNQY